MPGRDVNETRGAIAEATDAVLATLSARLDALVASWQLAIDSKRKAPVGNDKVRSPMEVLAELESELANLERRCADQRGASDVEAEAAREWERRAMFAVQDGRDDVARDALNQLRNHMDAATRLATEASELEVLRDSYRNAVKAVRMTNASVAAV
ncbi:MAG TPA: hypothetical protein VJN70_00225 [Gemmatimonadaceae bacterium]|nr:hypothetical protein [Gemmatimonadaceae bacterium]